MDKAKKIECIRKGFSAYEEFVDKQVRYVYKKENNYKEIIFHAKKTDFMHLCGVKYKDPKSKKCVSAKHFYSLVKSNKISPDFLIEKPDGTTDLKLDVIRYINDVLSGNVRVIDEGIVFANSRFDGAIRTRKKVFALGMSQKSEQTFFPNSLLNLKSNKDNAFKNSYEVHKVYCMDKSGEELTVFFESNEYQETHKNTGIILT